MYAEAALNTFSYFNIITVHFDVLFTLQNMKASGKINANTKSCKQKQKVSPCSCEEILLEVNYSYLFYI